MTSTATSGFVTGSRRLSLLDEVFCDLAHKRSTPDAERQAGSEDDHGVYAHAPGPRPVDVLEVQPEGELVEGQCGADSVCDRAGAGQPVGTRALLDQPHVSDDQKQQDAPDQMMDVEP